MKEKILAAIKAKFPNVKLTQKRLDALAAKIEAKVKEDETKIDAALDALNEIYPIEDIAKDDHAHNTAEGRLKATQKKLDEKKPDSDPDDDDDEPEPDDKDTPKWAKALMKQNKKLSQSVAALQGEKVATDIKSKATEKFKDAGVPQLFWEGRTLPDKLEELDEFVTKTTASYDSYLQELKNQGMSVTRVPKSNSGGHQQNNDDKPKATKEETDSVLATLDI